MDDFFDKVKKHAYSAKDTASKLTKQLVDKTSNVVGQTKLTFAANETEHKINELYADLGKTIYEQYKDGGEVCDCMLERCQKLDDLNEEATEIRAKIAELKDSIKCECGEFNKKTADFCSKCGKHLKHDEPENSYEDSEDQVISIKAKRPVQTEEE
ncbi:MAG: hypothetical protein PUF72_07120 [Clostridiales bacterium]|nr:hypothetical protein [Clostridiales bacterium]